LARPQQKTFLLGELPKSSWRLAGLERENIIQEEMFAVLVFSVEDNTHLELLLRENH
jgi:hypothetical protein